MILKQAVMSAVLTYAAVTSNVKTKVQGSHILRKEITG